MRMAAAQRLTDQALAQTIYADIAKNASDGWVRNEAVAKLTDQAVLADIAKDDSNSGVRKEAVKRLTDQAVLAEIAKNDSDLWVRGTAFAKLTDQALVLHLAWFGPVGYMRTGHLADEDDSYEWDITEEAVAKLTDTAALADIAKKHRNEYVREVAIGGLEKVGVFLAERADPVLAMANREMARRRLAARKR